MYPYVDDISSISDNPSHSDVMLLVSALKKRAFTIFEICASREDEALLWYDHFDGNVDVAVAWIGAEVPHPSMAAVLHRRGIDPDL